MPIPKPNKGEDKSKFISRCVSFLSSEGTGKDNKQRVAICFNQWRKSMEKQWIKFLKDYAPEEGDSFKKGDIIEVDEDLAKSLVTLKFAENADPPASDDIVEKAVSKITKTVEDTVTKTFSSAMDKAAENFGKNVKLPAQPHDKDLEDCGGFETEGLFVKGVIEHFTGAKTDNRIAKLVGMDYEEDGKLIKAPTGQNTQDYAEGGVLIPITYERQIWEQVADDFEVNVFPMAQKKYTSGNSLTFRRSFETNRADGTRHQGGLAYWLDEADQYTSSTLKWSDMSMRLHKLTAMYYATMEEIEDADISLNNVFRDNAAKAIRWKLNLAMFEGNGVGKPLGAAAAENGSLETVAIEGDQTLAESPILHANLNKMYHRMIPSSRGRAAWYVHPNLEEKLPFIVFNDDPSVGNRPVYIPAGGLTSRPHATMYGRPVIPCEICQALGTAGDILFIDWSQMVSLQKRGRGVRGASSIHLRFDYDETAFKFNFRVDAQPLWSSTITDFRGGTTRSPFVRLATRS